MKKIDILVEGPVIVQIILEELIEGVGQILEEDVIEAIQVRVNKGINLLSPDEEIISKV